MTSSTPRTDTTELKERHTVHASASADDDPLPAVESSSNQDRLLPPLPPADRGKAAWLFLAGSFLVEALVWGFPYSFGIFQAYYASDALFVADASRIAVIGTAATGILYLALPFTIAVYNRWPRAEGILPWVGLLVMALGLALASFSRTVTQLIATQGVLYALGGTLLYAPTIIYLDQWFIQKKGLALGMMWCVFYCERQRHFWNIVLIEYRAGSSASGIVVPFIMNVALSAYTFRTVLRAWCVVFIILIPPLLFFVKPRLPTSQNVGPTRNLDWRFLSDRQFWLFSLANCVQGLGFFVPGIYLPIYAASLGASTTAATATVALLSAAQVVGRIGAGVLSDRTDVTIVMLLASGGAAVAVLLGWGLATSVPALCVASLAYGLFGGGFSTAYSGIIRDVQVRQQEADSSLIFGLLVGGRGVGAVVSGLLSGVLIDGGQWRSAKFGYGSQYGPLIVFTGVTAIVGGIPILRRKLKLW